MHKLWVLLLLFITPNLIVAQAKIEQEFRIDTSDIPAIARAWVDSLKFNRKIKWYREIGNDRTSLEAKTKHKGQRYSLEFTPDGMLEDVEIVVHWRNVPKQPRCTLVEYLHEQHSKFTIEKIQAQFVRKTDFLAFYQQKNPTIDPNRCNYEVVVGAKHKGVFQLYEYLFSGAGAFIERTEVSLKSSNNILILLL